MLGILIVIIILRSMKRLTENALIIVCFICAFGFGFLTADRTSGPNELLADTVISGARSFFVFLLVNWFIFRKKLAHAKAAENKIES